MSESANSTPSNAGRIRSTSIAASPYAPSTCSHTPRSVVTDAIEAMSSTIPKFVVPPVATTANTASPCASSAAATASPCSRPPASGAAVTTSTSMTDAADAIDECASALQTTTHRSGSATSATRLRRRAASRAATSAERLPIVPPWTNTPPDPSGSPNSDASQCSTSFSAYTTPAPSSHEPP